MKILVVNSGSLSLKFNMPDGGWREWQTAPLVIPTVVDGHPSCLIRHPRGWWRGSIFEFIDSGFPPSRLRVDAGMTVVGGHDRRRDGREGSGPALTFYFLLT